MSEIVSVTDFPLSIEDFENAIHDWFSTQTGLFTVWANQGVPQPEYPFGLLKILSGPIADSPAWDHIMETDLTRPRGQEIEDTTTVPAQITVSCQALVELPDGRNPVRDARSYILRALGSLSQYTVQSALRLAGIAIVRAEPVLNLTDEVEEISRANLDVVFRVTLLERDFVGYIEKVHAESTQLGVDQDFGVE